MTPNKHILNLFLHMKSAHQSKCHSVRESMKGIWISVVNDPKSAVSDYFGPIMDELIRGMSDRSWRTREASCLGLGMLLCFSLQQMIPHGA